MVLWPVFVPLAFLALLLKVRSAMRSHRVPRLAHATAFLWRDYEPSFDFWEVVDLWRKARATPSLRALFPPRPARQASRPC